MHPYIRRKEIFGHVLIVAICALVFFFALHAKTSMYDGNGVKVTPVTSSKLWLNGQKMEPPAQQPDTGLLLCMAFLCLFALAFERHRLAVEVLPTPPLSNLPLQYLRRFLRPPPALS